MSLGVACSGVLIAPDAVLTAAHCLQAPGGQSRDPRSLEDETWYVSFEADLTQLGRQRFDLPADAVGTREVLLHSAFSYSEPARIGLGPNHDLALMRLAKPVGSRAPSPVLPAALGATLREQREVQIGGYGLQNPDGETSESRHDPPGLRAIGRSLILEVAEQELRVGAPQGRAGSTSDDDEFANKCSGDSGGPSLLRLGDTDYVVGIASRGYDGEQSCYSAAVDVRVDTFEPWITAQLARWQAQTTPIDPGAPHAPGPPEPEPRQPETQGRLAPSCQWTGAARPNLGTWLCAALLALGGVNRRASRICAQRTR